MTTPQPQQPPTSKVRKRLIIVGNSTKKTSKDHSSFINASDIVVRFNAMQTYAQHGSKTDMVFFRAGRNLWGWDESKLELQNKKYKFTNHPNTKYIIINQRNTSNDEKKIRRKFNIKINSWKLSNTNYMPRKAKYSRFPKHIEPKSYKMFSSGMTSIHYFLMNPVYSNYDVYIVGFSWEGNPVHDWVWEKNQTLLLQKLKKLKILE